MTEADVDRIFLMTAYESGADVVLRGHICCGPEREGMWDTGYVPAAINKGDYLSIDMILNQYENLVVITETGSYPVMGCPADTIETSYW